MSTIQNKQQEATPKSSLQHEYGWLKCIFQNGLQFTSICIKSLSLECWWSGCLVVAQSWFKCLVIIHCPRVQTALSLYKEATHILYLSFSWTLLMYFFMVILKCTIFQICLNSIHQLFINIFEYLSGSLK